MPAPQWEDLGEFEDDEDGFTFPAVITLQAGGTIALSVFYDEKPAEAELADFTHDTTTPRVTCQSALVRAVARGDEIAITFPDGTRTFEVLAAPKPDGTGMAAMPVAKP